MAWVKLDLLDGKGSIEFRMRDQDEQRFRAFMAECHESIKDAERYRWLKEQARKKTAYDIYGDGAHWSIGFHSDDGNDSFDQAIDKARE